MDTLWLYRGLSRIRPLSYRAKIMVVAFLGTHVPLIALIVWAAAGSGQGWSDVAGTLAVALAATLAGTGATLLALTHLLRPVMQTAAALRGYRSDRALPALPRDCGDEVGVLMRDTCETLEHLEAARLRLETIDAASGLPNRARFAAILAERLARPGRLAVAVVVCEAHRRAASSFGSDAAESVLGEIAARTRRFLGPDLPLARVGGDRLAFLVEVADDAAPGCPTALELLGDLALSVGGSIPVGGIALAPGLRTGAAEARAGASAETLLDEAEAAAEQADGGGRPALFSPEAQASARRRLQTEQELRLALQRGEFVLHYQPIVDLAQGRVVGAEALIRWHHPERGLVPPGTFIPVAEAAGLTGRIGTWALERACAQLGAWLGDWREAGIAPPRVAVNLAADQFLDPGLVGQVRSALDAHRIAPDLIELELTESAATADHDHTRRVFSRLRDIGVRIAIDDFGTGFASMSQLRRLPFDKLKVDREFVAEVGSRASSQAICRALLALGHGLGLDVLAEGTETEDEVRWLSAHGCRLFQGYAFARPVPAAAFPVLLGSGEIAALAAGCRDEARPAA